MFNLLAKSSQRLFKINLQKSNPELRFFKTVLSSSKITPLSSKLIFDTQEIEAYNSMFPIILETITKQWRDLPEVTQRNENILKRLLPHDMLIEGRKIQALYKTIQTPEKQTTEALFLSRILGWSYDFLLTSILINDDILDEEDVRWDYTCLHKQEDVKHCAINYAVLIENLSYLILKEFCSNYPWYTASVELMHTASVNVAFAHSIEQTYKFDKKSKLEKYTFEKYNKYCEYLTTHSAIIIPFMFATYCSGDYDDKLLKKAEDIFIELAIFTKMQDDMFDHSNDHGISVGAFTWLIVQALAKASSGQKKLIYQHYGKSDPQSVLLIGNLYDELDVYGLYERRKNKSFDYVYQKTKNANIKESHKKLFYKLIEILYEVKIN